MSLPAMTSALNVASERGGMKLKSSGTVNPDGHHDHLFTNDQQLT
jgi:hypothetical protein